MPGVCVMDWTTWWCVRHGLDYLVVCASWIGLPGGVCVMDWTTWWCVRHGLDYLMVCSLCKSAAAIKINLCLFIFSLDFFPARLVSQRVR